jgi:hypothetical protein
MKKGLGPAGRVAAGSLGRGAMRGPLVVDVLTNRRDLLIGGTRAASIDSTSVNIAVDINRFRKVVTALSNIVAGARRRYN